MKKVLISMGVINAMFVFELYGQSTNLSLTRELHQNFLEFKYNLQDLAPCAKKAERLVGPELPPTELSRVEISTTMDDTIFLKDYHRLYFNWGYSEMENESICHYGYCIC